MLRKLCIFAAVAAALFIAPAALPVTAMAIRVMAISMDMVTATSTAMSKTIGTIVSIGMLPSAVAGGAVAGGAVAGGVTAKVPAGGDTRRLRLDLPLITRFRMVGRRLRSAPFTFC